MRSFEPCSATPDQVVEDSSSSQDSASEEQATMEDNAARMLLALSKIVSKEISTDSSCITKKTETLHEATSSSLVQEPVSPTDTTIPKSIEIRSRDWGSSVTAAPTKSIPREIFAPRSDSYLSLASPLTPSTLPTCNGSSEGFNSTTAATKRYRTVSLAGDDLVPNDRELSPLLLPLTPPQDLSFAMQNANTTPPRLLRKHQIDLENEAIRRVLVSAGAKAFSAALASAAVITPVPEQPRPILAFPEASLNTGVVITGNDHLVREVTEDRAERHLPMNLPPLLFHNHKKAPENVTTSRATRPCTKRSATVRKLTSKKQQLAHGPRSKKKTSPKKQSRQRHTGKKFSWKAYPGKDIEASLAQPSSSLSSFIHLSNILFSFSAFLSTELEEFLITNREEYLSFSARNYTIEQRDYNNRLTSRLLEHAEANGYSNLFASCAFSAVRDRIRSYYKSYVQSFKRRRERQEQQDRLKKLEMNRH